MRTLQEIEQELSGCVKADQRTWARIYRLMDEVERRQLYRQRPGTPSFTRWLNTLAEEIGVHVSLLWARKKAGKNYEEYKERDIIYWNTTYQHQKLLNNIDRWNRIKAESLMAEGKRLEMSSQKDAIKKAFLMFIRSANMGLAEAQSKVAYYYKTGKDSALLLSGGNMPASESSRSIQVRGKEWSRNTPEK